VTARGTALLLVVLAVLAGLLWATELGPRRAAPSPADPPALLDVPPSMVARIDVEGGGRSIVAVRHEDRWTDAAGRRWDGDVPGDLVTTLAGLRPLMVVDPDPTAPADFGLGPGAERLHLLAADGRTLLTLDVGNRNPSWTGLYARRDGRKEILLVGGILHWELEKLRQAAPAP
jgi:hypothetical protein